ncbi:MAG: hypothetical protein NTW25_07730 [Candidatus Kapabacteria bacterium]|nr:hypothetical protein [Candidatus Kapabacteria bacterium]
MKKLILIICLVCFLSINLDAKGVKGMKHSVGGGKTVTETKTETKAETKVDKSPGAEKMRRMSEEAEKKKTIKK